MMDSEGAQHYGATLMPLADANLMLAMLYNYDADAQQIYNELLYSRDGLHFHRFPGNKPFMRGKIGEWYYGHAFLSSQWVQDGNDLYQLANYCTPLPHFAHEVVMMHSKLKQVTADDLRLRFEKRQLATRWPHFDDVGGWEGLSREFASFRSGASTVGIARFRKDGWIAVTSRGRARLTGRLWSAPGRRMALNGRGDFTVELLDADGRPLPGFSGSDAAHFSGDDTGRILRWGEKEKLPDVPFRPVITFENGALYTIELL